MVTPTPHLKFSNLVDLAEGRSDLAERATFMDHLSGCQSCTGAFQEVDRVVSLMRANGLENAPASAINRAIQAFLPRVADPHPILRKIAAMLKFDSAQMSPAFGMRGGSDAGRQLLFEAGQNEVHLKTFLAGSDWVISGQILGPCAGGSIQLNGEGRSMRKSLDPLCEFSLPPVPCGHYALTFRLDGIELEVPELKLGD